MKNKSFLIRKCQPNLLPLFHHLNEAEMETSVTFKVITPDFFCDIDYDQKNKRQLLTYGDAVQAMDDWADLPKESEHYNFWQEKKAQCRIVKVTTTIEEI